MFLLSQFRDNTLPPKKGANGVKKEERKKGRKGRKGKGREEDRRKEGKK